MKNNKLNRMYFGHKKERIQIAHLNRPMMLVHFAPASGQ